MSSSRLPAACLVIAWLVARMAANALAGEIGCPLTHDGKPLKDVELFEGPPSDKLEIVPRPGRFVVPQPPKELWATLPNYTLGCTYHGSIEIVTVELPRDIRVCEFRGYPKVACH